MRAKREFETMTRRAFAKLLAMAAGAGVALAHGAEGANYALAGELTARPVFAFYPLENGKPTQCTACLRHAEHKRFATRAAAEQHRAHPGCNCALVVLSASDADYARMFGGSGAGMQRAVYDLRWADAAPAPAG